MMLLSHRRPSPAMVVATLALSFALVGSAAAAPGALTRAVSKSQVKTIAKKQANKAITKQAPGLSVASAANAANATNAETAAKVGGLTPHKLFTKIANGTGTTTVLSVNGLTLSADCSGGALTVTATTGVNDAVFGSNVHNVGTSNGSRDSNFDTIDTINVMGSSGTPLLRGEGTFTYSTAEGAFVTGTFYADDSTTFGTFAGCVVVGSALSG
jgi:hypothetical protein